MDGSTAVATGFEAVISSMSTLTSLMGQVWTMMTSKENGYTK